MYDTIQPFTNLAKANMEAFARLAQPSAVADSIEAGADAGWQSTAGLLAGSNVTKALVEWGQALARNQATFVNEWTQIVYGMFWQGQALVSSQAQEASQELQRGVEEIAHAEVVAVEALQSEAEPVLLPQSVKPKRKGG